MPFDFHNWFLLAGLAAVVVPVLIHLLNRRRYDVVEWGAMRFLDASKRTRRKVFFENFLLLLLRMLVVAVLVVGLAGPFLTQAVTIPGTRPVRDLVLVVDGSASMGCLAADGKESAHQAAVSWANSLLDGLQPGDGVGLIDAREQPVVLVAPTVDHARVRQALANLPPPGGGCDAPAALAAASALLKDSTRGPRDILVLTDGQRAGYADTNTKVRWELLATQEQAQRRSSGRTPPNVSVVVLDPDRAADPANWGLGPLRTTRGVVPVGREVLFRGDLEIHGHPKPEKKDGEKAPSPPPPHRLSLIIDGQRVRDLTIAGGAEFYNGMVPFSFTHRFGRPGSHLVSVVLEADPPADRRPDDYKLRDLVPGDNRQDFALEVVPFLPVLLVDGANDPTATDRGVAYLRAALAPLGDPTPAVRVRAIGLNQFDTATLNAPGEPRPRVVVFHDVASLSQAQGEAVEQYLKDGGGVLVALGASADATAYNERLYRQGRGWLPARLDKSDGDENPERWARVFPSFGHPALELFRDVREESSPGAARFPRHWQVVVPKQDATANTLALLGTPAGERPFLVERSFGAGRVVLSTVPLDTSWGSTLPRLPAYVPLVNELVNYLAGVRTQGYNLEPGQPLRYQVEGDDAVEAFALQPPGADEPLPLAEAPAPAGKIGVRKTPAPRGWTLTCDATARGGVYRLGVPQRVAVLCPADEAEPWKKAGAVEAGDDALLKRILDEHWADFDLLLCTPATAGKLPRLEKELRPRGLQPDEASGTLLPADADPAKVLAEHRRRPVYYVVGRDRAETDLTPLGEAGQGDLTRLVGAKFPTDAAGFAVESQNVEQRPELWWMVLLGLVALLCFEGFLTSRIARGRVE